VLIFMGTKSEQRRILHVLIFVGELAFRCCRVQIHLAMAIMGPIRANTGIPPLMHTAGSRGRVSKHSIMHLGR
jgi:hypothetical protein